MLDNSCTAVVGREKVEEDGEDKDTARDDGQPLLLHASDGRPGLLLQEEYARARLAGFSCSMEGVSPGLHAVGADVASFDADIEEDACCFARFLDDDDEDAAS